jgi:hypothetical protein
MIPQGTAIRELLLRGLVCAQRHKSFARHLEFLPLLGVNAQEIRLS